MRTRQEMIDLFVPFVKDHELSGSEIIMILDFCSRELHAREVIPTTDYLAINKMIREWNKE